MYFFNFNLIKFFIIYKRIEHETNTHYYPKINIDNDIFLKRYFNSSRRSLNTFDKQLKSKNRKILGQKMFQIQHPKIRARCLTHAFGTKHLFNRKTGTFSHFYVPFCNTSHALR